MMPQMKYIWYPGYGERHLGKINQIFGSQAHNMAAVPYYKSKIYKVHYSVDFFVL